MNHLKEREEKSSKREVERKSTTTTARVREPSFVDNSVHTLLDEAWERNITRRDLQEAAYSIGMPEAEVAAWLKYMHDVAWAYADGSPVNCRNFRRSLRMWHKTEARICERADSKRASKDEVRRKQAEEAEKQRMRAAAVKPESWELCKERCAYAKSPMGCMRGVVVPPIALSRPIPPEECKYYDAKEVAV